MSGFHERIRALYHAFDRTESPEILREIRELEFQKRKAEDAVEREQREARKAREVAEKQKVASTNWDAAIDERIHGHLANWLWAAIDERTQQWTRQWWEHEGDVLKDAIGSAMGTIGRDVRDKLTRVIEDQQRSFEAKLTEQEKRLLSSSSSVVEAQ